jgi:hypothetical protein
VISDVDYAAGIGSVLVDISDWLFFSATWSIMSFPIAPRGGGVLDWVNCHWHTFSFLITATRCLFL